LLECDGSVFAEGPLPPRRGTVGARAVAGTRTSWALPGKLEVHLAIGAGLHRPSALSACSSASMLAEPETRAFEVVTRVAVKLPSLDIAASRMSPSSPGFKSAAKGLRDWT